MALGLTPKSFGILPENEISSQLLPLSPPPEQWSSRKCSARKNRPVPTTPSRFMPKAASKITTIRKDIV